MTRARSATAPESGDALFAQTNLLLHEVQEARAAVGRARLRARQVLPHAGSLLVHIRRLPVLELEVSESPAGHAIAGALGRRRGLVPATVAAGVLELPDRREAYLVGRSMQAVRTGISHARRRGLSVVYVTDDGERRARVLELVGKIRADFARPLALWANGPRDESWFVVDDSGSTLGIAILAVDGAVARLDTMINADGEGQSPSRYLLSAHVFMDLIDRGVAHVVAEGSLFLPSGLLYFQKRLGFRQMNIKLSQPHQPARGSRLAPLRARTASLLPERSPVPPAAGEHERLRERWRHLRAHDTGKAVRRPEPGPFPTKRESPAIDGGSGARVARTQQEIGHHASAGKG
jgi:hypothetical protein